MARQGRNDVPDFPARLKELRQQADLSQEALARLAGTTASSVAKLERGERAPSLDLAGRLADALGVTVDELRRPPTARQEPRPPGRPRKAPAADQAEPQQAEAQTPAPPEAPPITETPAKGKGRKRKEA